MTAHAPVRPLFRPRAITTTAGSQIGEPLRTHWRGVAWFTAAAGALVAMLLVFVSVTTYAPVHHVPAYTDARSGLVRLRAPGDGWVVQRIAVGEGAVVRQGDLLAVLGHPQFGADGTDQQAARQRRLQAERTLLDREIQAARDEAAAQHRLIGQRIAGLRAERRSVLADQVASEQLLVSLQAQSEQISAMAAQGFVTRLQAAQKLDEATAQASRVATTRAAVARVDRDTELAQSERRLVETRLDGLVQSRLRSAGELDRLMLAGTTEAERALRAPQDGTVSAALIASGQSVVLGQALFTLTPHGQPLVLRLLVPARAAAAVHPGMAVKFVLRAYPEEKFGRFDARITSVSDAPALPTDLPQAGLSTEPVYLALAETAADLRAPDGRPLELRPGMLAEALVPVERRRVIEWLLKPWLRGLNQSAWQAP